MTTQPPIPRRPKDTQPFYLVGAGLLILFVVLAIPAIREWWRWVQLQGETRTAEARITRLDPQAQPAQLEVDEDRVDFSGPMSAYAITYEFEAAGEMIEARRRVPSSAWRGYAVGDTVSIEYPANNPQLSALQGDNYARLTSTLYLLLPLLGFAALWGSWQWEARRLSRKAIRRP